MRNEYVEKNKIDQPNRLELKPITLYHLIPIADYCQQINASERTVHELAEKGGLEILKIAWDLKFAISAAPAPPFPEDTNDAYWPQDLVASWLKEKPETVEQ